MELSPNAHRCRITYAGVPFVATVRWLAESKGLVAETSVPRPTIPSALQPGRMEISLALTRRTAEVVVLRNDERVRVGQVKVHQLRR